MPSMSKAEMRAYLWEQQDGLCTLCGEVIEKDPIKYGKRTGKPLKSQNRLQGHWLMRIVPKSEGGRFHLDNLTFVHANCGNRFNNWLYSKEGEEWINKNKDYTLLFGGDQLDFHPIGQVVRTTRITKTKEQEQ